MTQRTNGKLRPQYMDLEFSRTYPTISVLAPTPSSKTSVAEPNLDLQPPGSRLLLAHHQSSLNCAERMADFVKGIFGGQKPAKAATGGDDGTYSSRRSSESRGTRPYQNGTE
jgi:hypothetical protein